MPKVPHGIHVIRVTPVWKKNKIKPNNLDLPSSLRLLIVGPSGSGKTILLLKMLLYNLDYDSLVICSPSLDSQTEYQIFIKALNAGLDLGEIEQIFVHQDDIDDVDKEIEDLAEAKNYGYITPQLSHTNHMNDMSHTNHMNDMSHTSPPVTIYKDPELMPSPEELKKQYPANTKILVIIDDCMQRNQKSIESLFIYGRPLGINTIYLTQAFFETDKNSIRGNCNAFIFFETSVTDLRCSYEQVGSKTFKSLEEYKDYARVAWSFDHGYFYSDSHGFKMNSF